MASSLAWSVHPHIPPAQRHPSQDGTITPQLPGPRLDFIALSTVFSHLCTYVSYYFMFVSGPLEIITVAPEQNGIWHAHPWFLAGHSRGSVNICEIKTAEQGTVGVLDIPCLYYFSPSIFI